MKNNSTRVSSYLLLFTLMCLPAAIHAQTTDLTPANSLLLGITSSQATYSIVDEQLTYTMSIKNPGQVEQQNVVLTSSIKSGEPVCVIGLLSPGIMATCTAVYAVAENDLNESNITNVVSVTSDLVATPVVASNVVINSGAAPSAFDIKTSVNPKTYRSPGDKLTYTFTITNDGAAGQSNVSVSDSLLGDSLCQSSLLSPTYAATCTAEYVVTQADVTAGMITNTSSVTSDQSPVPAVTTTTAIWQISDIPTFSLDYTSSPDTFMNAGETITYSFSIINNGDLPLMNVTVTDPLLGGVVCRSDSLWPTFSVKCTGVYTVTQDDVDRGSVTSTVDAIADGFPAGVSSATQVLKFVPVVPEMFVFGKTVSESDGQVFVRVGLSPPTTVPVTVLLSTRDNTARDGIEYIGISDVIEFEPGRTERSIPIDIIDNDTINANPVSVFDLVLSDPVNAVLDVGEGVVEIVDNEEPCTPGNPPGALTYLSAKYKTLPAKQEALQPTSTDACEESVYYSHVDPDGSKKTMDQWLRFHDFLESGAPEVTGPIDRRYLKTGVVNAEYHNMIDLGFGRDMYCKVNGDKVDSYPCIVQNYLVSADLTQESSVPASYQLSVTMEFLKSCTYNSFGRATNCGPTAFYVYDAEGRRINSVDLDGNGRKNVPQVCLGCHGGDYADDGTSVTTIERGDYLPFDENLFAHFERDSDTTTDTYDPATSVLGIDHPPSRQLNSLLRPLFPLATISSSDEVREFAIGRLEGTPASFVEYHPLGTFQADVRNTFCTVCHIGVQGDYALKTATGSNCKLCHDDAAGGGSKSNLQSHLCRPGGVTSATLMPNARVTHNALYSASLGEKPYDGDQSDVVNFITAVCGASGMVIPN